MQFLTRLPTPQVAEFRADDLARCAVWFPLVGLIIGAVLAGAFALGGLIHPVFAALLTLLVWVWITGGLHLDGLADLSDALGAAQPDPKSDPKRFLDVLHDPHLGSFGVIAIVLALVSKLVLLALLPASATTACALLLIPAWARLGPLAWSLWLKPIHAGMGERFAWAPQRATVALWTLVLLGASLWSYPALAFAPVLVTAWGAFLQRRLGGQCGDALGAGVEITEIAALMLLLTIGLSL